MSGPSRPSSGFVPLGDLAGAVVADAGREVVVDVDGVDACSASRCRSSDWEPSAFETRA